MPHARHYRRLCRYLYPVAVGIGHDALVIPVACNAVLAQNLVPVLAKTLRQAVDIKFAETVYVSYPNSNTSNSHELCIIFAKKSETMKTLLLLADGFETIEALAPIDVMTRAGIDILKVSISDSRRVVSSHGIVELDADMLLSQTDGITADAVILPGGFPGYANLAASAAAGDTVRRHFDKSRTVAAICGAPSVLAANGIALGRRITCHTSVRERMQGYIYQGGDVVQDGNLITGAGAGVCVAFSLAVLRAIAGDDAFRRVAAGMEVAV